MYPARRSLYLLFAVLSAVPGCAGTMEGPGAFTVPPGDPVVTLTAKSFSFSPAFMVAQRGTRITLNIENRSMAEHNFTIEDPRGRTMRSVDLPAGETIPLQVHLKEAGTYHFNCDRLLHTSMGMKGRIVVE